MIKHIVFWQLKDEALGNTKARNMELVKEKLMSCAKIVPGIVDFEVGLGGTNNNQTTFRNGGDGDGDGIGDGDGNSEGGSGWLRQRRWRQRWQRRR